MANNGEEYEEEERYSDSAMWKIIQQNTFTRWTNEHLKAAKMEIKNMEKDFADGLKLIQLIQVLSGKKFARFNKKPSFRTQKFENVTMCLKFLEEKEGIKLVNIDSSDIVDQKLKLIMGLIWTLILHYSITMSWDDDNSPFGKDQTPKQRLLAWIQSKIPEKNISNFTSDWNDGTAIAALVDALGPGLVPDAATMDPKKRVPNAKQAMDAAEKWLDVPQVIKPEEMCNPNVDELSMMTYLSRFPSARLKSGSPAVQKPNAHRIKAYGPGLEPNGNVVGFPARFIVETANAGTGELEVVVENPKGVKEKVELLPNNDRTLSYNCLYHPTVEGTYKVTIKWSGQPSTKQPYLVNVTSKPGDPGKVTAQGPGIEKSGVHVNRKTYFEVLTKGAGVGVVDVGVVDPQNRPIKSIITKKSDDVWYVEYTAETPGLHSVNINFAGKPIPKSPYPVGVGDEGGPAVDASRLPGKPVTISPRDVAAVSIATPLKAAPGSTAPATEPEPQAKKPVQPVVPVEAKPEDAQQKQPAVPGKPLVPGKPGDKPGAPAAAIPVNAKNCWASGKGIQPKGNRLGESPTFQIHTENAGTAEPRAMVMGPGGTAVQNTLKKVNDDLHDCTYKPTRPGLHIINVTFGGQSIQKSPFRVDIGAVKVSKVEAFGPGLESGVVNEPAKFTVKPNGEGPIGFKIEGPSQAKIDVTKNPDQTEMYVTYWPTVAGEYAVRILSKNDDIPKSPYMVDIVDKGQTPKVASKPTDAPASTAVPVADPSKVTAFGPGLEKEGNLVGKWADFTVDATKAGKAELHITAVDRESKTTEVIIVDNQNLTFSCKYLATKVTTYTITIHYASKPVPKSPFLVNIKDSALTSSKVKVYGPAIEKPVQAKLLTYYIIDCKEAGQGEPQVTLKNDKGLAVAFQKKDLKDRTYRVEFTAPIAGVYTTTVTFGGSPVPRSPFQINVQSSPDASKVKVYGPALEKPVNVNEPTYFIVDCKEAGQGEPRVVIMSVKGASLPTKLTDQGDRTYKVEFTAPAAGPYNANVQFASKPVPQSPFKITVQATSDVTQVYVKDLPEFVPVNKEVPFEVVTAGAGPGKVKVVITSPTSKPVPSLLAEKPGQSTGAKFTPVEKGPYKVEVFFAEKPVAKSPFTVTAQVASPFNVKAYGPAIEKPVFVNEITFFVVDCKEAGPGQPQIKLTDDKGQPIPFNVLDQKDLTFRIEFTPIHPGSSKAEVSFENQPAANSPYTITIVLRIDVTKVKVYGPALEKPVLTKHVTYFIIDCKEAGPGTPTLTLKTEGDDKDVPAQLHDIGDGTFRVEFIPEDTKPIYTTIFFVGQPLPKNPYKISVVSAGGSDGGVKVYGPAVEAPVPARITTHFVIDCKEVGPGQPEVSLIDEVSKQSVPFTIVDNKDGTFKTEFTPQTTSPIQAYVGFKGQPVPKSPFRVEVSASPAARVKVYGPAVEGPVEVLKPTEFTVDTTQAGPAIPEIALVDDVSNAPVPHKVSGVPGRFKVEFTPTSPNPISAHVTYQKQPVPKSPFKIVVGKKDPSKVKLYGPALEAPVKTNLPTHFTIDTKEAGPVKPVVSLANEDNKEPVKFTTVDKKDGTYDVEFTPVEVKPIIGQVKADGEQVPKSPFRVTVEPGPFVDPSKVKLHGLAVEGPVKSSQPTHFVVDAKEAGPGKPDVALSTEEGTPVKPIQVLDNHDNTFNVAFTPVGEKPITAQVKYAGKQVPKSPFKINLLPGLTDPSKVKLHGPAVEGPVKSDEPTYFVVDAIEAGPGKPEVKLTPEGSPSPLPATLTDNHDGTHNVDFKPQGTLPIIAEVKYAGQPVPKTPFKIHVTPSTGEQPDASKVKLYGPALEGPASIHDTTHFTVDAKEAGPGRPEVKLTTQDSHTVLKPSTVDNKDGTYDVTFVPTLVQPIIGEVTFNHAPVPQSPFRVEVKGQQGVDPTKVKLTGPAIEAPVKCCEPTHLTIDCKEAGPGVPEVRLEPTDGSAPIKPQVTDNHDGTYKADFTPTSPNPLTGHVTFSGVPVPQSPFQVNLQPLTGGPCKVKVYGPAIEAPVKQLEPTHFIVDAKEAGPGPVEVEFSSVSGVTLVPQIVNNNDGTFKAQLNDIKNTGEVLAYVKFAGNPVPKSPFSIQVIDQPIKVDPSKVKVYGPAVDSDKVPANTPTFFVVDCKEAGPVKPEVKLAKDDGQQVPIKVTDDNAGTYKVDFTPTDEPVTATVTQAGQPVPQSPVRIIPVKEDLPSTFSFQPVPEDHTSLSQPLPTQQPQEPQQPHQPQAPQPHQQPEQFHPQQQPEHLKQTQPQPQQQPQQQQPTGPHPADRVRVFGPAVEAPVKVSEPTFCIVDARDTATPGQPVVSVTTPQGVPLPIQKTDNKDGTYKVEFTPNQVGVVLSNVSFAGKPVPGSPFKVTVEPKGPSARVSDLPKTITVGQPAPFNILTSGPKKGPVDVQLVSPTGVPQPAELFESPEGVVARVTAKEPGIHKVAVKVANEPVEGSPFTVEAIPQSNLTFAPTSSNVIDPSKVKAYGPGLSVGTVNRPCDFTIDTSQAGPGNLGLTIDGPTEAKIECFDKGSGVFDVSYLPNEPGEYTINITFDDAPIPHSPFKAQVNPEILVDVSGVKTYGPGVQPTGVFLDSVTEFTVDTKTVHPKGIGHVKAILTSPSGTLTEAIVKKEDHEDAYTCLYTPFEQGLTKIDVTYDGLKVPGSAFVTDVQPGCDPSKVKVYGPGIVKGEPNVPAKFTINTRGAGLGGVGLSVVGPTEPKVDCVDNQDGTLSVEYLPDSPGDYEIGITFAEQPVPGSPFIVPIGSKPQPQQQVQQVPQQQVFPERVKCFGPGLNPQGVKQGQSAPFTILPNQPVNAPVSVTVTESNTGVQVPVQVNRTPTGTYDVAYTPVKEGPIKVDVLYGGTPVPGSPFHTVSKPAIDLSKVIISGDGVKPQVSASIPVAFTVDTRQAAPTPLPVDVELKNPQGKVSKPQLSQLAPGVIQAVYTPEEAGPYQLSVKVAEREIPPSPIRLTAVPTGNPENVVVPDNVPLSVTPGQLCFFKVQKPNTTGLGNVTCKVTKAGQPGQPATEVPCTVQDNHDGTVTVSYPVPQELDAVLICEVKFGGVLVPRGRFTQKVGRPGDQGPVPAVTAKVTTGGMPPSPATAPFTATSPFPGPPTPTSPSTPFRLVEVPSIPVGPNLDQVSATVVKPTGESVPVQVVPAGEGNVKVVFHPTEAGPHILKVLYAGQPVPGDPFSFFVHASKPGQVTAYGPGLISGRVGYECVFNVYTKNAGPGGLALAIEGPSKAEIRCRDNKDGSATITYVPTTPGEYKIIVKHGGQPITGAPFIAKITGEDRTIFTRSIHTSAEHSSISRQSHVTVGSTRHLTIQVSENDLTNLSAVIRSPSGQEEPCGLKRQPNGQLGISFTPRESGEHLVTVFRAGSPIPGSPFRIYIQATEVGDASKVKVYGRNITTANANEFNEFIICTREAGVAGLSISVQGPGKVEIKCTETEEGTTNVSFKPTEPGIYNVTIKYGDKPVPGSPFTINVAGTPSGRVKERIVRQQQAASISSVGTTCELNITMPGINVHEVEASVQSPSGQQQSCQVVDLGGNRFKISFSPSEAGVHYVSLKHRGLHIPGSPFQFTVGPIVGGGPEKVRAVGPGLERGQANNPCHFTVITREAGAGSLSLGVEGPSKAIIDFLDRRDGTSDVNYLCSEPGEYLVSVKFNGQHITDSPFKVYISSTEHDHKLNVHNLQQHGLPINTQTQFLVELTGIQGKLDAKVVAPSGIETVATVVETAPGRFSVTFVPKEGGIHYVHLLLNGNHVSGSPYPIQVGVVSADPTKVRAYGDGLYKGQSGHPCKFIVNTTESGPGALSVGISGPSKVELNTREVEEGYEFTYTPLAPGPYLITIKYAGNSHIQGSPFKAQIDGVGTPAAFVEQSRLVVETVTKTTSSSISSFHSDSSKVVVTGNGLSQLFVNQEASLLVDGSQAGYNLLWVGVAGPHIPVDKIFVTHLGNLRYSVKYQVSQPGNYQLFIKWGDQLIPGCPFNVVAV